MVVEGSVGLPIVSSSVRCPVFQAVVIVPVLRLTMASLGMLTVVNKLTTKTTGTLCQFTRISEFLSLKRFFHPVAILAKSQKMMDTVL